MTPTKAFLGATCYLDGSGSSLCKVCPTTPTPEFPGIPQNHEKRLFPKCPYSSPPKARVINKHLQST